MKVKICCVSSLDEARMAVNAGAAAIGLVSEMPSGPGVIPEDLIGEISAWATGKVETFLLTSLQIADRIIAQQRRCNASALQLCDTVPAETYARLRTALPRIRLVQVIHVAGPDALDQALAAAPQVDALLLDSGNPALPTKQLGGTGRTHNWDLSAKIAKASPVPVYLAGGLRPGNVAAAIESVRPYGVDVCSGVRSGGRLDRDKLANFMLAATGG